MEDQRKMPDEVQDIVERSDELTDEQLDKVSGGASWLEALAKALAEAENKQAEATTKP